MKCLRSVIFGMALVAALPAAVSAASVSANVVDGVAALVDEDVVLYSELDRRVNSIKSQIRGRGGRLPPEDVLRKQVLDRLITESIQLQMAKRGGVRISDEQLNATLADIASGNKMTPEQFRQTLAREGVSYPVFREDMRNEMMVGQVRQRAVSRRVFVSEQEINNLLGQMEQAGASAPSEYRLGHILIAVPENASTADLQKAQGRADELANKIRAGADFAELAVANSAAQEALEGGDLGWRSLNQLPTLFADAVAKLKVNEVAPVLRSAGGFHVLKVMAMRGGEARDESAIVTQTNARHILLKPSAVLTDVAAREKLVELRNQIIGGADFAALAKTHSNDTGSAAQGGDLGWASPGKFVPEFEQALSALGDKEISAPFRSQFGWHIVQVLGRRVQDQGDELKKDRAAKILQRRKFDEEAEAWLREIRGEAYIKILAEQDAAKSGS